MCAMGIDFASFYDYSVGSWKYSDGGIFLFSYQIITQVYRFLNSDLFLVEDTKKTNMFTSVVTEAKTKDIIVVFLYICLFLSSGRVDNHIRYFYCDTCEACKSVKCIHCLSEW